jgi:hypothetical protein
VRVGRTDSEEDALGRKLKKLTPANSEEMVIVESLGFGRYSLQTLGAPDAEVISRSSDLIRKVRSPDAARCVTAKQQALLTVRNNREYVIESVLGERGIIARKTKEYKIKWQDYSEVSWVSHGDIDKNCQPWLDYNKRKKQESRTVAGISTIAADLLMLPAATMIQHIIIIIM